MWNVSKKKAVLSPDSTIGIVGGGQLARMIATQAAHMGLKVIIYTAESNAPAIQVANDVVLGGYTDRVKLKHFAEVVDVITCEFENIPAESLAFLAKQKPGLVKPGPAVFEVAQHRLREKDYVAKFNIPTVPYYPVTNEYDLRAGVAKLKFPCLLKTATMGYDGKGQYIIRNEISLDGLITELFTLEKDNTQQPMWILEGFIDFVAEISVIAARNGQGQVLTYPVIENTHRVGVLHRSIVPATVSSSIQKTATKITSKLIESLKVEGLLTVEFFVTSSGNVLFNEMAPRPHNSGHWTIEAAVTSQFEQTIRAVMGWPLGSVDLLKSAEMINLLGKDIENWEKFLSDPYAKLHLYGKDKVVAGRKMGHVTRLGT